MAETTPNIFANPELQQARQQSSEAASTAYGQAATLTELPDALRAAVTERFKESPLHGQFEGAAQNFLTAVPQARADLASQVQGGGPILNPNQQQSILAGRRAAAMVPLISLNDLIQSQTGGIENLIGAGTRAFGAQTQRSQGAAELMRQRYADILNQLVTQEDLRFRSAQQAFNEVMARAGLDLQQQQLAEQRRQFDLSWPYQQRMYEYDLNKPYYSPGSGGGGTTIDISPLTDLYTSLLGNQGLQGFSSGAAPSYTPIGGVGSMSSDGQWYYDQGGWIPVRD